jgi:type IV secretory pathway VirB2 component (pilin)
MPLQNSIITLLRRSPLRLSQASALAVACLAASPAFASSTSSSIFDSSLTAIENVLTGPFATFVGIAGVVIFAGALIVGHPHGGMQTALRIMLGLSIIFAGLPAVLSMLGLSSGFAF